MIKEVLWSSALEGSVLVHFAMKGGLWSLTLELQEANLPGAGTARQHRGLQHS